MVHDYIKRLVLHLWDIHSNLINVLVIRTIPEYMYRFIRVIISFMLSHDLLKIVLDHVSSVPLEVKVEEGWLDSDHQRCD